MCMVSITALPMQPRHVSNKLDCPHVSLTTQSSCCVPSFLVLPKFFTQCTIGGRKPPCQNQLDSCIFFDTIPACARQTRDRHRAIACTPLARRRMGKNCGSIDHLIGWCRCVWIQLWHRNARTVLHLCTSVLTVHLCSPLAHCLTFCSLLKTSRSHARTRFALV